MALAIHERTGLQVDVVKGSSLASVAVELPASRGEPRVNNVSECPCSKSCAHKADPINPDAPVTTNLIKPSPCCLRLNGLEPECYAPK